MTDLLSTTSPFRPMASTIAGALDLKAIHPEAMFVRILGVNYVHLKTEDDGDLYFTPHGVPFIPHLQPANWYETKWFKSKRQRLQGTSTVYRIPTKPIENHPVPSLDIVIKWSRVGQEVDLNTFTLQRNTNAEFNTPFEEFALLDELRRGEYGPRHLRILTQKPLAIYVPPERLQPWQTGRSREKLLQRTASHPGIAIDVLRAYIMIYAWIDGINAVDALANSYYSSDEQHQQLAEMTQRVDEELTLKGYVVADHKPTHMIIRMKDGLPVRDRAGKIVYALVDFELMARTPPHEDFVRSQRRSEYLIRQRERLAQRPASDFPEHLRPAHVLGVPYVFGRSESTSGTLWVVGNDPELFPYFLPERWRGTQVRLSDTGQTFYTQTKDRIHLVWRISRAGDMPPGDLDTPLGRRLLLQGYNSPFEEFAMAMRMQSAGLRAVYPRAIYMTASPGEVANPILDDRAYHRMSGVKSPTGNPVLPRNHDYVTIWGYWRGVADDFAVTDPQLWTPLGADSAATLGLITSHQLDEIMTRHATSLAAAGFEDSNLKPDHVLLSYVPGGSVKTDTQGQIELRHCNFEMVRAIR